MATVDPAEFHAIVYDIARMIPYGMVTSYDSQDLLLVRDTTTLSASIDGQLTDSRLVGQAMKFVQAPDIPWQRVVGSNGTISERGDGGEGAAHQAERLREEGVEVMESGTPVKFKIDLKRFGWFPQHIHLEASDEGSSEEG